MKEYTAEQEEMAMEFALAMLMPEEAFRQQMQIHDNHDGTVNTKAIAEHFGLPIDVVSLRGQGLGLLRHPWHPV